jgi:hypothetical protein
MKTPTWPGLQGVIARGILAGDPAALELLDYLIDEADTYDVPLPEPGKLVPLIERDADRLPARGLWSPSTCRAT